MSSPLTPAAGIPAEMRESAAAICPACDTRCNTEPVERFHQSSLFACERCDLQFWYPVSMPDAAWYERAYQGRDQTDMPLEPGHRYFLSDPKAPRNGRLLDLGCGVGNFLAAARDAGFDVTGVEFNASAVRFAQRHYGLHNVFAMRSEDFQAAHPQERFDVVTFFEVLEHQADPQRFLEIAKDCLVAGGFLALSVPNRERWQKGVETLDYPPNHLTRWSRAALRSLLERNGFEILSMRREVLGVCRAAQVLSMGLRTGMVSRIAGECPPTLADLAEMKPEQVEHAMKRLSEHCGHRWAAHLARWKNYAMVPPAALLLPYLRLRGYTGLYLYCLVRRTQTGSASVGEVASASGSAA